MTNITKKQHFTAQAQTRLWELDDANGKSTGLLTTISFERILEKRPSKTLLQRELIWSQSTEEKLGRLLDNYVGKMRSLLEVFDGKQQRSENLPAKKMSELGASNELQIAFFNYAFLLKARYEAAMTRDSGAITYLEAMLDRISAQPDNIFQAVSEDLSSSFWDTKFDFPVPDSGFFYFLIRQGSGTTIAMAVPLTESRIYVIRLHGWNVPIDERYSAIGQYSAGTVCNRKIIVSPRAAAENISAVQQEALSFEFMKYRRFATWNLWSARKLLLTAAASTDNKDVDYLLSPLLPTDEEMLDLFVTGEYQREWTALIQANAFSRSQFESYLKRRNEPQ